MKEKEIKEELRLYSERCYVNPLTEAGFVSYRNDLLNWYKIYNGIICHFHILVGHSRFPMLMLVWFMHPTYLPAPLNMPVAWANFHNDWIQYCSEVHFGTHIVEPGRGINIPKHPQLGAEVIFKQLVPQMERLQTREALYNFRREGIISIWKKIPPQVPRYNATSPDFADEALMMHDKEMFPFCIDRLETLALPSARRSVDTQNKTASDVTFRSLELFEAQLKALKGEDTEQYYEMLKVRKAMFMKKFKLIDNDYEL